MNCGNEAWVHKSMGNIYGVVNIGHLASTHKRDYYEIIRVGLGGQKPELRYLGKKFSYFYFVNKWEPEKVLRQRGAIRAVVQTA